MSFLNVSELTPLVPSPLSSTQLQAVIDRIEADLTAVLGASPDGSTEVTETIEGGQRDIFTKRKIGSVSSVTEYALLTYTTGDTLTANTEFYVWPKQGRIQRLLADTFGQRVDVVYVPENEASKWKQAIIDLVRIYISQTALKSESLTDSHSFTAPDNWDAEIRRVARRLQFTVV